MYSTSLLTTVKDCDSSLEMSERDVATYDYRITTIAYRRNNSSRTATENQEEITILQGDIANLNATIAALPEGPSKEDQITKRMRKELRLRTLTGKASHSAAVDILDQELELTRLNMLRGETVAFADAVRSRRAEVLAAEQ